jgi:parvulin-like peptidyl-prolyl isomerase
MTGEQARARRIVVGTEEEARDLVDRLEGGADFAALAERFSKDETTNWRGGETDLFGAGSMYGMADVALAHEPGELIPPFESGLGWEIVRVIEKVPSEPRSFAEMEQPIKTHLATEETRARVDAEIDELRRSTRVEIDERALSRLSLPS